MRARTLWAAPVALAILATMAAPASAEPAGATAPADKDVVMVSADGQKVTAAQLARAATDPTMARRVAIAANGPTTTGTDGQMSTYSIVGPADGRTRVTTTDLSPYSAIAHIEAQGIGGCTGFLVSRDTVLTAAHCLYSYYGSKQWLSGFWVSPGRDRYELPFGACSSGQAWVPNDWISTGEQRFDFGAIKLDCDFGTDAGWFTLYSNTNVSLVNKNLNVTGYPGDKYTPVPEMWQDWDTVVYNDFYSMAYNIDTINGQSGGPVWASGLASSGACRYTCAAGINTNNGVGGGANWGVRFNSMNMGHINYWIGLP